MQLIGNGKVITLNEDLGVINKGAVVIEGEEIKEVGSTAEMKAKYPEASFRDVGGKIIMPGMINTHMHFYSTFARGMDLKTDNPPQHFVEILEKLWWRLDNTLNEDDIYCSALYAVLDGIKKGSTTVFDHHASFSQIEGSLDIIAEVAKKAGIRANLSYEISDRQGAKKAEESRQENSRFLQNIKDEDSRYLGGTIGLHASFTLEDETLTAAAELGEELDIPFHIHTAEGKADVEDSQKRGYSGVVERLDEFGIWKPKTLAIHGVHLQEEELELLAERGCYLIHNPESNMGNAVGASPVKKALDSGLTVGLGTDGYTADMFESIKVANLLQKHDLSHPQAGWEEVPEMAFNNNSRIAGSYFDQEIGVLKPGAAADIIVVDYSPPTPLKVDNAFAHILFGINGGLVDSVMVGGKVLMEDREVKVLDEEKINRQCRQQAEYFWHRF